MTKNPILIAGEPLEVLDQGFPSLRVVRPGRSRVWLSWQTDTVPDAAWARAIERCAADMITPGHGHSLGERRIAALLRISAAVEVAKSIDR